MEKDGPMTHSVSMSRADFLEALKPVKGLIKLKDVADALISMEGEFLTIAVVGLATSVAAEGAWPGEVRVPGRFIVALAKMPPPGDPIRFEVRDGRLYVGALSVACAEQDAWKSEIELPLAPSLEELLQLSYQHPPERIERAGLKKRVEEAREKAAALIQKAAPILAPLGITERVLREFLEDRLKKGIPNR